MLLLIYVFIIKIVRLISNLKIVKEIYSDKLINKIHCTLVITKSDNSKKYVFQEKEKFLNIVDYVLIIILKF